MREWWYGAGGCQNGDILGILHLKKVDIKTSETTNTL